VVAASEEAELAADVAGFTHDPLGHVLYAYPWGKPNTELANEAGPRKWQRKILSRIGERLKAGEATPQKVIQEVIQMCVASGHGIGKSALVAWILKWAMDTFEDTRGVVTANTDTQLRTKTWPEISKWHRLSITAHWFTLTATSMYANAPGHDKTWRIDLIPWSENNPEAFAGLHNKGRRIIVIFDEASAIADKIWEVTEGALTDADTEILWFAFGNPTRTTGRFRECWGKNRHRWEGEQIDSRTVEGTNKAKLDAWVEDNGEDSDFVRIRVRGLFPRASSLQLIGSDVVLAAQKREARYLNGDQLLMALDVARGGEDNAVVRFRRGLDARSIPATKIPGVEVKDSMKLIARVTGLIELYKPDVIYVDATGVGGPVGDRLRQLGYNVIDIQFGSESPNPKYANLRTYMWMRMAEQLRNRLAIDSDPVLEADLVGPEYTHDKHDRMILEAKDHMKERGLASPDDADALAMLCAYDVPPKDASVSLGAAPTQSDLSYNPFAKN
jgi:hypothetical protein